MIKIILVSATPFEIEPTRQFLQNFVPVNSSVTTCVTGVGMVNTAFELGKLNGQQFDIAINAGIAGSFGALAKGDVVNVTQDCFAELGAENDTEFLSIDELGFGTQHVAIKHKLYNTVIEKLPVATGITVNTTHGHEASIEKLKARYNADVETMEGAAFIHAANAYGWQSLQLRSVSNAVEKRNRDNWNIPLAINNLNATLIDLIKELDEY